MQHEDDRIRYKIEKVKKKRIRSIPHKEGLVVEL